LSKGINFKDEAEERTVELAKLQVRAIINHLSNKEQKLRAEGYRSKADQLERFAIDLMNALHSAERKEGSE
jgi:hypothetical protein